MLTAIMMLVARLPEIAALAISVILVIVIMNRRKRVPFGHEVLGYGRA